MRVVFFNQQLPFVSQALRNLIARMVVKKMMLDWRMVNNACDAATLLQQVKGGPEYVIRFHAFEGEDHLTATCASVGQALAVALEG